MPDLWRQDEFVQEQRRCYNTSNNQKQFEETQAFHVLSPAFDIVYTLPEMEANFSVNLVAGP
jgi:hypothetical protein